MDTDGPEYAQPWKREAEKLQFRRRLHLLDSHVRILCHFSDMRTLAQYTGYAPDTLQSFPNPIHRILFKPCVNKYPILHYR